MDKIQIPWYRYAVISYLADKLESKTKLGKTALQKLIYLLQEAYNVPLEYNFKFHFYGPFSSRLSGDLDYVDYLKGVDVEYEQSTGGYYIKPGVQKENIINKGKDFLEEYRQQLDEAIENFGTSYASNLELLSTIVYVSKEVEHEENHCTYDKVIERTGSLKPKFNPGQISEALEKLKEKNLICQP
ncbi:MAG: hypothetical protein C4538_03370 [Nitrospiraceae bacterium]|nr:MAG: hypothetical protein C4538_03370 [Nitrospiraceae bacterium]